MCAQRLLVSNASYSLCMKSCLVLGAGGFIGSHLVKRLKANGCYVRGVDLKDTQFSKTHADEFMLLDLRDVSQVEKAMSLNGESFDEIYQLAADMGGAGYIFTGENDANVMHNSATINLNVASTAVKFEKKPKIFYSSSACIYPERNQLDPLNPNCSEASAYPAAPDSEYGWEKLFSERLYLAFHRNYNLDVRIARFHNIFGPEGTWFGGKEKAPAAICRKVAEADNDGHVDVWGDGKQTRSFLYIDECIEGVLRLMNSNFTGPVNIGSEEMISINDLAHVVAGIANKEIKIHNIKGPTGVAGRRSDNRLIKESIDWEPSEPLIEGLRRTYHWIERMVKESSSKE